MGRYIVLGLEADGHDVLDQILRQLRALVVARQVQQRISSLWMARDDVSEPA